MSEVPLKLLQPCAGTQTDPLTFILLELLVRDGAESRLCVTQVLHFLSFLTQPDRCSCVPLLAANDLLQGFAVPLAGALVSSSKASRLVMGDSTEQEAMGQLLLETAKHTLQLATAIVQDGKRDGEASAAANSAVSTAASGSAAASASALAGRAVSGAAVRGRQLWGQLGSASSAGDREQGVSALVWGACHLAISAANLMLRKADTANGETAAANVQLRPSLREDVKAVQELLQDLHSNSSSSSSSRSKPQAGCSRTGNTGTR